MRATVCEGVSGYRFFVCSPILESSSTYLPVDKTKFLIQHRREVVINAPPAPEAMQSRRVAGYFQRKGTLSFLLVDCSFALDFSSNRLSVDKTKFMVQHRFEGGN